LDVHAVVDVDADVDADANVAVHVHVDVWASRGRVDVNTGACITDFAER